MIITCKKEIPFRWIAFAVLPWASTSFNAGFMGAVFFFSLKKFIDNPAGVTFILSLPGFVSIVLQPVVSFLSDRIWTRFGRRKPFILTSLIGAACCMILLPLMPNFWALLFVFMFYSAFADLNSPMEPFKQEIVPPHQRGLATGTMNWCANLASLTFYFIAFGRFDDLSYMGGFPVHGEMVIYWSSALLLIVMAMLVTLGIREMDQKSALRGERLSIKTFAGGLADRELWPVYLLVVGSSCLNFYSGLGPLSNLLYTDQWSYTKQEMGVNIAVGGILNLVAIAVLTFFADRFNRMRAYQILICLSLSCQVAYYCYINFVLPDKHPSLIEIIVFGETLSILSILTGFVYVPLVYDYVKRNKMGTYNAGSVVTSRLTTIITLNGVGLFVWGYAVLFQPPAGEMTRVVLRGDLIEKADILTALRAATWSFPNDNQHAPSTAVSVTAWQADGTMADTGRCWEVRLHDPESEKLAAEKASLDAELTPLEANIQILDDKIAVQQLKGVDTSSDMQTAQTEKSRIDGLAAQINSIKGELTGRAEKFNAEASSVLKGRIISDGEQILGANLHQALLLDLPTTHRAESGLLEKLAAGLKQERADFIDLRPLRRDSGFGITVSAIIPSDKGANFEHNLQEAVERVAAIRDPSLFQPGSVPLGSAVQPAVTLNLMVIEDPVKHYVSPITRVVNLVLALFKDVPDPNYHLMAMARNLRVPMETNHVRVDAGSEPKTLSVTAVLPPAAGEAKNTDALVARLTALLPQQGTPPDVILQVRQLYDRITTAAAAQHITVARPTLMSDYAAMKYDYMSGYLWMFVMGTIGICITFLFARLEAKGMIRKRGVEEAEKS